MSLKKTIFLITGIIIFALTPFLSPIGSAATLPQGYELVAENAELRLYLNPETTEVAVQSQQSGALWLTNPLDHDRNERIARGAVKETLNSQFSISYYTQGNVRQTMNNYSDSIRYGQFEIKMIPDGVRIDYILGEQWQEDQYLPLMMSQKHFDEMILANVPARDRSLFTDNYLLMEIASNERGLPESALEVNRIDISPIFGDYMIYSVDGELRQRDWEEYAQSFIFRLLDGRKDINGISNITTADLEPFLNEPFYVLKHRLWAFDVEDMVELLRDLELDPLETSIDYQLYGFTKPTENSRIFTVPIEYRIEDGDLLVRVPVDEIEYPLNAPLSDNETLTMPIHSITLLDFFGAALQGSDGYLFIPEGSGALINFDNLNFRYGPYIKQIYGSDRSLQSEEREVLSVQAHLPVFGLVNESLGHLGIIEAGDAMARIRGDLAGRAYSYNTISPEFTLIPVARSALSGELAQRAINVYQSRIYSGDIQVRYRLLQDEAANYVGMAASYQDYLVSQGILEKQSTSENLPFILELVGAVDTRKSVWGIPRTVITPLTTFDEAEVIVSELLAAGVDNLVVRYRGWMAGGVKHNFPKQAKVERMLGGAAGLNDFQAFLAEHDIPLLPDVSLTRVSNDRLFDGFSPTRDAARMLNRQVAKLYQYDMASGLPIPDVYSYNLSPRLLPELTADFLGNYSDFSIKGLSLAYLGKELSSDFREEQDRLVDRQESQTEVQNMLAKVKEAVGNLMVEGGNAYVLPYADYIVDLPLGHSNHRLLNDSVPFYQMVVAGYLNFAGEPLNMVLDYNTTKLKLIETGSLPYFRWVHEDALGIKDSGYDSLYSTHYGDWLDEAVALYTEVNNLYKQLDGSKLVDHEIVAPNLHRVSYENGDSVILNYGNVNLEIEGNQIKANSYLLVEGGESP